MPSKLYIVIRNDLEPGQQLAQSTHAAFQFSQEFPDVTAEWHKNSNYLIVLSVDDESALAVLQARLAKAGVSFSTVFDPDYGVGELTALAIPPGHSRLLSSLPLALRDVLKEQQYTDVEVQWVNGYYDGPLSGVCKVDGQWLYFDCINPDQWHRKYWLYELTEEEWDNERTKHASFEAHVSTQGCKHLPPEERFVQSQPLWDLFYDRSFPKLELAGRPKFGWFMR